MVPLDAGVEEGFPSWASENFTGWPSALWESFTWTAFTLKISFPTLTDDVLILKPWIPVCQSVLAFLEEPVLLLRGHFGLRLL